MKHERSFLQNGRIIQVKELPDLIALRLPNSNSPQMSANKTRSRGYRSNQIGSDKTSIRLPYVVLGAIAPEVPLPQVRAFEDAGWVFVKPSESVAATNHVARAKVFVKSGGRLALGTNKLVVKLREDVTEEQANEILEPYNCWVIEKMRFAPGLFRVKINEDARMDALDVANQLISANICEFAEPELLEVTGGR